MEYRANFLLAVLGSIGGFIGGLFGLFLFYRTGYSFEGWRWEEALMVFGMFTILEGISSFLLVPNLSHIVRHVQEGTLDFILLKPIDSQFWLSFRMVSPWGIPDIVLGFLIIAYCGVKLQLPIGYYFLGMIPLMFSLLILYSLWFSLATLSIWFVKINNATEVLRGLIEAGRFPIVAYPAGYRLFFTFVIPVAFLTTAPAEIVLGRGNWMWIYGAAGISLVLLIISRSFWRFAQRFYTSASS